MKFGENLKMIRKHNNYSQEELADKIGVTRQSVSKWETGEAYPEMTNMLALCTIFKCNINDLVNDNITDIDSISEDIKQTVVKFKQDKQKKLKAISKAVYVIAKIMRAVAGIGIVCLVLGMIATPFVIPNIKISENNVKIFDRSYKLEIHENKLILENDEIVVNSMTGQEVYDFLTAHDNTYYIIALEYVMVSLTITLIIALILFKTMEKLFDNLYKDKTPFTLENVKYIKNIAYYILAIVIFPYISGTLFELITQVKMNAELELVEMLFALIIFSLAYIFEYGYEIQLDSKGRIYGDENE